MMTQPMLLRDISLRLAGLALIAGAAALLIALFRGSAAQDPADAVTLIEAAGGFLSGSVGTGLLLVGHHIYDEASASSPWMGSQISSRR